MDTDERAWPQSGLAGEWTWQEGRGYVLAEDGVTDTRDVAAGLAHGDEQAALAAAEFWALAAEVNASNAGIHAAQAQLADAEESTPHTQAELADANDRHTEALGVWDEIQDIREDVQAELGVGVTGSEAEPMSAEELVATGDRMLAELAEAGKAHEAFVEQHAQTRALYDELYDASYYQQHCEGDGAREDNYCDGVWEEAERLAAAGATAAEYRLAAEWAEEIDRAGEAFDAAVAAQLAENGREPAAGGASSEELAKLLYDLDQARCARDDDETPEGDRAGYAQHVEHLEEQVALASGASHDELFPATPLGADDDPDPAGWASAAEAIANVPEWVAEQGPAAVADWVAEQCDRESTEGDGPGKAEEPSAAERAVAEAHAAVEAHLDEQDRAPALASAPAAGTEQEDVDE